MNIGVQTDDSMASGLPNVTANQETAETPEECPAKKKSKFQTFKNFFVKKKRKEAPATPEENLLKSSQSSDNVNGPEAPPAHSEADEDSGSKVNMGSKAMSHDSVFVSDSHSSEANDGLASSQDSLHGKVKSLQLQLKQAIRLGSPQSLVCGKKGEDGGTLSEDDGLPCSPPEISTLHTVLTGSSQGRTSSLSLEGSDSEDEQMSLEASSRPVSPLDCLPLDFSEPANFAACLDNSAARHRIAVKQRACAKRKPASREVPERSKVKILSGRVPLRVEEEPSSAVLTELSAEEKNEDVEMIETDAGGEEAEVSPRVLPASRTMAEEPGAPDDPAEAGGVSSSSSEAELDEEKSLPEADLALDLQESPVSLAPPGGHYADAALDSDGEVPAEEAGSLLQEVLSSLECPLTSAFVLKPDARDLQVSADQGERSRAKDPLDDPMDRPPSSPAVNQGEDEQEEGTLSPSIDTSCGLGSRDEDEQLVKEEESVESDEDEDEEAEVMSPAEVPLKKEADLPAGKGEEAEEREKVLKEEVMEQEEVMEEEQEEEVVEQVEEEEAVVEEVEEQDAVVMEEVVTEEVEEEEAVVEEPVVEEVEEEDTVMEEDKVVIKEDEVIMEKMVIQQQEEEGEEVEVREEMGIMEVGVGIAPEAPQQKATAEFEEEDVEDDEEDVDDLKVEVATDINEPEDPEETKEVEPEPDSGDLDSGDLDSGEEGAQGLLSGSWSYLPTAGVERSEFNTELFTLEVTDDTAPPQPLGAAFSPSSEEPSSPEHKPSPSADISVGQDTEEPSSGPSVEEDRGNVRDAPEPSRARFTIAPAWQRSLSGGTSKEPPFASPIRPEAFQQAAPETASEPAACPDPPQSPTPLSPLRQPPAQDAGAAENPFGIRLRRTPVLLRYSAEGSGDAPVAGLPVEPAEPARRPQSGLPSARPTVAKKPDPLEDSASKLRKTPDAALSKGAAEPGTSPSWISVAKQKQKSFQENPIEETPARKGSLEKDEANLSTSPVTVSCSLEISKPAATEKDGKRTSPHPPPVQAGQDEPPWLALAKKKAKAWSEMPQIVQ
ncbi:capping protein inhibiting regulator of actin dynamics isoform X2 [Anguilla anguilla]|uniref:capping protein inhibiting regulator of actin dynamics isoform X2 n=1 Tax=Anguilla anguilla TaxID=7936 RepID=UPI0015AFF993|nr:capping protein inhibiting regulator of actin dynamics isoform X2 [Anguilla anguilla]